MQSTAWRLQLSACVQSTLQAAAAVSQSLDAFRHLSADRTHTGRIISQLSTAFNECAYAVHVAGCMRQAGFSLTHLGAAAAAAGCCCDESIERRCFVASSSSKPSIANSRKVNRGNSTNEFAHSLSDSVVATFGHFDASVIHACWRQAVAGRDRHIICRHGSGLRRR
jgi:hypothetical protein